MLPVGLFSQPVDAAISYDEAPKWPVSTGSKKIATTSYGGRPVHEYPLDVILVFDSVIRTLKWYYPVMT